MNKVTLSRINPFTLCLNLSQLKYQVARFHLLVSLTTQQLAVRLANTKQFCCLREDFYSSFRKINQIYSKLLRSRFPLTISTFSTACTTSLSFKILNKPNYLFPSSDGEITNYDQCNSMTTTLENRNTTTERKLTENEFIKITSWFARWMVTSSKESNYWEYTK